MGRGAVVSHRAGPSGATVTHIRLHCCVDGAARHGGVRDIVANRLPAATLLFMLYLFKSNADSLQTLY